MTQLSSDISPRELRELFRNENLIVPTAGLCPHYVQANLIILQGEYAEEYDQFLRQNPKPCPVLEIVRGEIPISHRAAPGSNLLTDFPLYRIYRNGGLVEEVPDISYLWTPDMIAVLIGCSLTFEAQLAAAGIHMAHYENNKRVPMYDTNIPCKPSGRFHGNYVVSMRPIPKHLVNLAIQITEAMPYAHGGPVHIGDPNDIGVKDIMSPEYGDPPEIGIDEIPVFWACGVTAQSVAIQAQLPLSIAHSPGYMLVTDVDIRTLYTERDII